MEQIIIDIDLEKKAVLKYVAPPEIDPIQFAQIMMSMALTALAAVKIEKKEKIITPSNGDIKKAADTKLN